MSASTKDVRTLQSQASGYVTSPSIRVNVGQEPDDKDFFVHQDLICPRSGFFKNAMKESWKEAQKRKVDLSEEDPDTFALYLELLYTGALPIKGDDCEYIALSKLYVLAEMLIDDTTKDVVLASILARTKDRLPEKPLYYPGLEAIETIYAGTTQGSPARRLIVDLYTEFGNSGFDLTGYADAPKDFLYEMTVSLLTVRPLVKALADVQVELTAAKDDSKSKDDQLALKKVTIANMRSEKTTLSSNLSKAMSDLRSAEADVDISVQDGKKAKAQLKESQAEVASLKAKLQVPRVDGRPGLLSLESTRPQPRSRLESLNYAL